MAISGVVDADIKNIAQFLGKSRKEIALELNNYSYLPRSAVATDSGGHGMSLTVVNFQGLVFVDWGDGSVDSAAASVSPRTHTYAAGGTYTVRLTGSGHTLAVAPKVIA